MLGSGFGSGQRVYGLGPEGWKLCGRTGKYQPQRTVHLHDLGIADAFAAVKQLEHQGTHRILGDSKEPDSWLKVKGVELRPDRYIELHRIGSKWKHAWWLEIDTGSENQTQLKNKMFNYYRARQVIGEHWDADEAGNDVELAEVVGPASFPRVVFIVPDDDRLNEIRWLIGRGPDDAAELFDVVRHDEFSTWAERKAR